MAKNWEVKTLGEVCDLMTGGTPNRSHSGYFTNGSIKWLVSGDIHQKEIFDCGGRITEEGYENSNAKYLPVNSVLIALNGQGKTRGTVALLRTEATCNQSLVSINPKDVEFLLPEYLYTVLDSRYEEIRKMTGDSGNDRRGLNMPLIRSIKISIPPISEQKNIVKTLNLKYKAINDLEKNTKEQILNSKELFASYLDSILDDPSFNKSYLDDVCVVERGSSPRPIADYITEDKDGVNWIKIGDTKNIDRYIYRTRQKITRVGAEKSRYVKPGDLILSNSMSFGKPYIMKTEGYIHDGWFVLRPGKDIDSEFLYYLLSSNNVQNQIANLATGAVVKNVSGDLVKKVLLSFPDIKNQKLIVKKLEELLNKTNELDKILQNKLADLKELKKSYSESAFAGNL